MIKQLSKDDVATDFCSFPLNLVYKPFIQFSMHDKDYPHRNQFLPIIVLLSLDLFLLYKSCNDFKRERERERERDQCSVMYTCSSSGGQQSLMFLL